MKKKFVMPTGDIVEADMPVWKTPYNHDRDFESERTGTYNNEPSLTKQEFKDDADINIILARFQRTREPPPVSLPEHFLDLTGRTTYFEMASKAADANAMFYMLPAEKRAEHLNDPTRWADAVVRAAETDNLDELVRLGIDAQAAPEQPQAPTTGTPPPPATPAVAGSQAPGAATGGTTP